MHALADCLQDFDVYRGCTAVVAIVFVFFVADDPI